MDLAQIRAQFAPAIDEIVDACRLTDDFVDKEMFQIYIATIWGNAVLDPARAGIEENELGLLYEALSERVEEIVGAGADVRQCYEFIVSRAGENSMSRLEVRERHRQFLYYFAHLMFSAASS